MRTASQTEIAHYWSDAIGTYAPAGHWNAIAGMLLAPMKSGLDAEAEVFAELNVAMADAGIAIADAKYTFWFWRPITVIRAGAAGAPADPTWSPLLETPNHPSYISGHSGFSGAAAVVLTARFGDRPFSLRQRQRAGRDTQLHQFSTGRRGGRVQPRARRDPLSNSIMPMAWPPAARWETGRFRRSTISPPIADRRS